MVFYPGDPVMVEQASIIAGNNLFTDGVITEIV
jgi:hypothetical protein